MDYGLLAGIVSILLCFISETLSRTSEELTAQLNPRQAEKLVLSKIFRRGHYDRRIRPGGMNGTDESTVIEVSVFFHGIPAVSDQKMEFSTLVTLQQKWTDWRLKYEHLNAKIKYLTLRDAMRIWTPDVYFPTEREGRVRGITIPNSYVRIFPDGQVLYSARLSLTLACPMDLRMFPMDRQTCTFELGSYAHTKEELEFIWKEPIAVQTAGNLKLPRFHLDHLKNSKFDQMTESGRHSFLRITLRFRRDFAYYMIQLYVPTCLIIIVSWFAFWLDATASPARTTLGITTILATVTQTSGVSNALPPVSYTKAIDVWTSMCLTFVICAFLEYAMVNKFARYERNRENRVKVQSKSPAACCTWLVKFPTRSKRLDMASRILFPSVFLFFNVIYWSTYWPGA